MGSSGYNSRMDASMDGLITLATLGGSNIFKGSLTTLNSSVPLWQKFAKNTTGYFKGANHHKLRKGAYWEMIRKHNDLYRSNNQMLKDIQYFKERQEIISTGVLETEK